MASKSYSSAALLASFFIFFLILLSNSVVSNAQPSTQFYAKTCPNALPEIKTAITEAISREPRMAASLIRLHFHDCFVQGCDASILLEDGPTVVSEQNASPNVNSTRGFGVIEEAKSRVEKICPGVVSCADIVAVAARDASVYVGGPSWKVKLGRRDSTNANIAAAETDLPGDKDSLARLISRFASKGLNVRDMVALSGAHTIGQGTCAAFRDRIYSNGTNIDKNFAITRRRQCPKVGGDDNLAPLDLVTPNSFDNNYYKNLIQKKGLLESDQILLSGGSTDSIVLQYSKKPEKFASDFAAAMVKMGKISILTGKNGVIRKICSKLN